MGQYFEEERRMHSGSRPPRNSAARKRIFVINQHFQRGGGWQLYELRSGAFDIQNDKAPDFIGCRPKISLATGHTEYRRLHTVYERSTKQSGQITVCRPPPLHSRMNAKHVRIRRAVHYLPLVSQRLDLPLRRCHAFFRIAPQHCCALPGAVRENRNMHAALIATAASSSSNAE